jgi:acyl-CoA reductase-like NAD-dependent aldehyde dehydrogenase
MPYDVEFAKRRFPNRCEAIDELAARNENFRDLCFDIETAAALKRTWETSNAPERQVRFAECAALVEELEQEIAALLDAAVIVPFGRH